MRVVVSILGFLTAFFVASAASAGLVAYSFSGQITLDSPDANSLGVHLGDAFAGGFFYDSDMAAIANPLSQGTAYRPQPPATDGGVDLVIDGIDFSAFTVSPDDDLGVGLLFFVFNDVPHLPSIDPRDGLGILFISAAGFYVEIELVDATASLYDDESLPLSFDLGSFNIARIRLLQLVFNSPHEAPVIELVLEAEGAIDALTVVPEPSAWLLAWLAVGGPLVGRLPSFCVVVAVAISAAARAMPIGSRPVV